MANSRNQRSQSNGRREERKSDPPIWSRRYWVGTGTIEVAVWSRMVGEGKDEREVLNTTLKKTYKEKDSDEYKESMLFQQDLPVAAAALSEAFRFISDEMHRE